MSPHDSAPMPNLPGGTTIVEVLLQGELAHHLSLPEIVATAQANRKLLRLLKVVIEAEADRHHSMVHESHLVDLVEQHLSDELYEEISCGVGQYGRCLCWLWGGDDECQCHDEDA